VLRLRVGWGRREQRTFHGRIWRPASRQSRVSGAHDTLFLRQVLGGKNKALLSQHPGSERTGRHTRPAAHATPVRGSKPAGAPPCVGRFPRAHRRGSRTNTPASANDRAHLRQPASAGDPGNAGARGGEGLVGARRGGGACAPLSAGGSLKTARALSYGARFELQKRTSFLQRL